MKKIAIIPARGGSKRIPRKNIKDFFGKPCIAYSIENAINSNLFHEVMVSTDDKEIAKIAKKYQAKVPKLRSSKNSSDTATTTDVLLEVLSMYEEKGIHFDYGCCIYPTTPLLTTKKLLEGYNLIKNKKMDIVISAVKFSHPIQRAFSINSKKNIQLEFSKNEFKRTQDFLDFYHDAGQFYWFNKKKFIKNKNLFKGNVGAVILDEIETQDIDTINDWELAKLKYNKLKNDV